MLSCGVTINLDWSLKDLIDNLRISKAVNLMIYFSNEID